METAATAEKIEDKPKSVNDHTKNIYRKMNVHNRFELTALVNRLKSQEQE